MSDRTKSPDSTIGAVTVVSGVTVLPFPPIQVGDADKWSTDRSVLPVFDLEIQAASDVDLTLAKLYGGYAEDSAIASDDVDTVDFGNDELDLTTHGLESLDGPFQFTTTDTLPTGLALLTDYWVIKVDAGTIQVANSRLNAANGTIVAFSDVGVGTHTILGASAQTARWFDYGNLGIANDGAISLLTKLGYTTRVNHRPRTEFYAVQATLASAVALIITLHPVQDLT